MHRDAVAAAMTKILIENFGVARERIAENAAFRGGLGMDSYAVVDFVFMLGDEFNIPTELAAFRELVTFGSVVDHVLSETRAAADAATFPKDASAVAE